MSREATSEEASLVCWVIKKGEGAKWILFCV